MKVTVIKRITQSQLKDFKKFSVPRNSRVATRFKKNNKYLLALKYYSTIYSNSYLLCNYCMSGIRNININKAHLFIRF